MQITFETNENGDPVKVTTTDGGTVIREIDRPVPVVTPPKHISVGSFFDRFGALKYAILASADLGVKALITDCSVRRYIDLDNVQLPYGLDMLIAAGFAIDKVAILTAAISDSERA